MAKANDSHVLDVVNIAKVCQKQAFIVISTLFLIPYSYTLRLHMLFSMNVRCCVYLCDFSRPVHGSRKHGYHPESDQVRF